MIYIFEDHPDADISILFKSAYSNDKLSNFVYAEGNGNLIDEVNDYLLKTSDMIVVFLDTIPGNKDCYFIYREISLISKKNNYRIVILPIVCAEYYMIKSLKDTGMIKDSLETNRCIEKKPHITSNLMAYADKARYCKNFEKYCKYILKYNAAKQCLKPYNKEDDINGEYYRETCGCYKATADCMNKSLSEKAISLLAAYRYVPSGRIAENVKNLTEKEIWDIHRALVDEYNDFKDQYILVDSKALNKYKKISYIKQEY